MSSTTQPIIYGVPFSQPVRAVMWLMLYKQTPFEMVLINPGSKGETGSRNPAYLAKNPGGTIPTLEEPDSGFVLSEAHAIMCYLSNKNGWEDVYPTDHQLRAKVDWYLHYHHRNVRDASIGLVAPKIRKDLDIPDVIQQAAQATLTTALRSLESGWLAKSISICTSEIAATSAAPNTPATSPTSPASRVRRSNSSSCIGECETACPFMIGFTFNSRAHHFCSALPPTPPQTAANGLPSRRLLQLTELLPP